MSDIRLETARLILRPPVEDDLDAWAAYMADPVSATYIGGRKDRANAWRGMATMAGSWALKGFGMFSVIEKTSGDWIGRVGPWMPEGWPGTEVGWGVVRAHEGKGYATEAAGASIDWVIDTLGWTDIIHCIDPSNGPSLAVAAKLGSTKVGHEPSLAGFGVPVDIYGQSAVAWKQRRTRAGPA